jgi:hypothetical protein
MNFLLFILLLVDFFAFCCVLVFAMHYKSYFDLAFPKRPPKIFCNDRASTDAVIFYYITRIFLCCTAFLGFIYFINILRRVAE